MVFNELTYKEKKKNKSMCICQVLCIRPFFSDTAIASRWTWALKSGNALKLFLIFFYIGELFNTATYPFWGINFFF